MPRGASAPYVWGAALQRSLGGKELAYSSAVVVPAVAVREPSGLGQRGELLAFEELALQPPVKALGVGVLP